MFSIPILLTVYAGFTHAFEADHLLAVSNIVSQRDNIKTSLKDGVYWGLGHASTIFCIGLLMIAFRAGIPMQYFYYLEAIVGLMLIILAIFRLYRFFISRNKNRYAQTSKQENNHHHHKHDHPHALAYGIGLMHGLAGSGALILVVMSQIKGPAEGLIYLLIFGIGCIVGMMLASGLFSVPFSKKIMHAPLLQTVLILVSSSLCLLYGGKIMYENLLVS